MAWGLDIEEFITSLFDTKKSERDFEWGNDGLDVSHYPVSPPSGVLFHKQVPCVLLPPLSHAFQLLTFILTPLPSIVLSLLGIASKRFFSSARLVVHAAGPFPKLTFHFLSSSRINASLHLWMTP